MKTGKLLHPDNGEISLNYCQNLHQWQKVKSDLIQKWMETRFSSDGDERKVHLVVVFFFFFLLNFVLLFDFLKHPGQMERCVWEWAAGLSFGCFFFFFLVVLRYSMFAERWRMAARVMKTKLLTDGNLPSCIPMSFWLTRAAWFVQNNHKEETTVLYFFFLSLCNAPQ